MIRTCKRNIIKLGGSLAVTLPFQFCQRTGLVKGQQVGIVWDGHLATVCPSPKWDLPKGEGHGADGTGS
jgi:antitoxin component of MazEF toxin-antitoxin module